MTTDQSATDSLLQPDNKSSLVFEDKFITFVDVLGFRQIVAEVEQGTISADRLLLITEALGQINPPNLCPHSVRISGNLNFKRTQISDCVVASTEVSPAGIVNLLAACHGIVLRLMRLGYLCRGFVTRGSIYHTEAQFIGTGYMHALDNEKHVTAFSTPELIAGTPFVQLDRSVVSFLDRCDACVKDIAGRIIKSDGNVTAIWPFGRLAAIPSAAIGPGFSPVRWKEEIRKSLRLRILLRTQFDTAAQTATKPEDRAKIEHYRRGLDEVIAALQEKERRVDDMIKTGVIPYNTVI